MKKILWMAALLVALLAGPVGCSGGFSEGAVVGAAASGALSGTVSALQDHEEELKHRYQAALERLEKATEVAEKQAAEAEVSALEEQLDKNEKTMLSLKTAQTAATTDWKDPASIGGFSSAAAMLFMAWYLRRKKDT